MKIVFLDRATLAEQINLRTANFPHQWLNFETSLEQQVVARAQDADIIVVNKVPLQAASLAQLPKLKMIAVAATGTNNVDLNYAQQKGIVVSNIRDYAAQSVAEHSIALMFNLRRNIMAYHHAIQRGRWQQAQQFCFFDFAIDNLAGQTLTLIGGGNLGQATAKLAQQLGMQVVFAERKLRSPRPGKVAFEEALAMADVLSIHCPLNSETEGLIKQPEFAVMKPNALVINTARGGIVDEQALLNALQSKQIAGAASDVSVLEPPADNSPLKEALKLDNFILTPHVAWASTQNMQQLADQLIDNIEAFVAGDPRNQVFAN
ncbi:D-2-hydroxyacid dehydrogenase [Agarivorans gilvus]|uniref:Lactate dehydrogenase n=1 Tax=Agarivorans gilvus TaxID=680279 RepID=A0ABQ1I7S3_9ALTE|nr:D-2-hydroxyacid dehydrogenase [Agarivorans gilvus]GGB19548.1 lactate dehydrogenase [Agarivorans gilvus]